jgi:hypothetical protein
LQRKEKQLFNLLMQLLFMKFNLMLEEGLDVVALKEIRLA